MEEIYKNLRELINIQLKELKVDIDSLTEELKKNDDKFLHSLAGLLNEYSNYLNSHKKELESEEDIFNVVMILGSLESELNSFDESSTTYVKQPTANQLASITKNILSKIKLLSNRLWQLLSSLLKLKSWSISGDASINVLGLGGGVTIQLNFEP